MDLEFEKEIVLENDMALLKLLQVSDYENLLKAATEDKTLLQFSPAPIYTPELLKDYLQKATSERLRHSRYPFIIFDKRKNEYAGSSSFLNISNHDKRLEIGATWLGRAFQKTGLNRNCKFLMLSYVFDSLEFERVEFRTDERNIASRKAIEKIGGKLEGIFRRHTLMYDGFRRNTCCYSILKNEWEELKKQLAK